LGTGIVNMIKGTQKNLFPKGTPENPYSKEPRAEGSRKKRQFRKNQKTSDDAQQKAIEQWRKDNNLPPDSNATPPWAGK